MYMNEITLIIRSHKPDISHCKQEEFIGVVITSLNLGSEDDMENGSQFTSTVDELDSEEKKNVTLLFDVVTGLDEVMIFCRDNTQQVSSYCTLFVLSKRYNVMKKRPDDLTTE